MTTTDQQEYIITENDLFTLSDYIEAALRGDESKAALRRLFDQEYSVIRSRPYNPAAEWKKVLGLIATYLSVHGIEERIVCGERLFVIPGSFQIHEFIRYIAELRQQEGGGK